MIVIDLVTTRAGVRCVVIITIVAGHALVGDDSVSTVENVILIVNRKRSRVPVWHRGMTGRTIRRNTYRQVIWVYAFIKDPV